MLHIPTPDMTGFKTLCVYCGSRFGDSQRYRAAARALGEGMAENGIGLVYGGGRVGLMGELADAVRGNGGFVTGIIPEHLLKVEAGPGPVDDLRIVDGMHERKALMAEMSDGFVILPGGLGTLDEFFEILTWKQLRLHDKPIIIVDVEGYWAPLTALLDHIAGLGFASRPDIDTVHVVGTVAEVFETLERLAPSKEPVESGKL